VGFLITWTCYGTWVYGDGRGSVDDDHNVYGTPSLGENARRAAGVRRQMKGVSFRLTEAARDVVRQTITEHSERRGWELLAVNVRSNHVHVVVRFAGVTPEVMMGQWKLWSSRRLRERGLARRGQPVWTRHGSTRYLWKEDEFEPAVRYVVEGQDEDLFHDG
jgi:REP element-mobilizing transposase RayT